MNVSRVFAVAAIAATFSLSSARAQTSSDGFVPAEFPPASYSGRQYVDSRGCVFIRAGIDGNVTWVPRVTRSRKAICGFQPTFAREAARAAPKSPDTTVAAAAPAKPKPAPVAVRTAKTAPAKVVKPAPVANRGQAACRGGNAVSQQYVGRVGENVRCGPQQGTYATYIRRDDDRGAGKYPPRQYRRSPTRVAPRHVVENQLASLPGISVPEGYKPAWDDDRLNPHRAHQTFAGKAQMDQVWTRTLPRRLIRRDAGPTVTKATSDQYVTRDQGVVLSTRSAPAKAAVRRASHRYVQAGLFSTDTRARAAAKRIANTGLPARLGKVRYKGRIYLAVYAGPFRTQAQLDGAIDRVRAAGYRNVSLRK